MDFEQQFECIFYAERFREALLAMFGPSDHYVVGMAVKWPGVNEERYTILVNMAVSFTMGTDAGWKAHAGNVTLNKVVL